LNRLGRYLLRFVVLLVVLVVGFFGLVLIMSELGGEVVTLHTQAAGGGEKRTHLWVVDDAGAAWVRAGMSGLARAPRAESQCPPRARWTAAPLPCRAGARAESP